MKWKRREDMERSIAAYQNRPVWHEPLQALAERMRKEADAARSMMDDLKSEAIVQPPHAKGWQ